MARSARNWWAGMAEVTLAIALALVGFVLLVVTVTTLLMYSTPDVWYYTWPSLALRGLVSLTMIGVGGYWMLAAIWKVSATAERRNAIVNRAGEIELLNELWRSSSSLPTVPGEKGPPPRGRVLKYRLQGVNRSLIWLAVSGLFALVSVGLATGLTLQATRAWSVGQADWLAIIAGVICLTVAAWTVIQFGRQLLVLTGFGPTQLEISELPLVPGGLYQLYLEQPGRFRFQVIEVVLTCVEEATFSQGTNVRTEKRNAVDVRLFRKRGIAAGQPVQETFELRLPPEAMHSFVSANNRVLWKIIVSATVRGWPQFQRVFPVIITPPAQPVGQLPAVSSAGSL